MSQLVVSEIWIYPVKSLGGIALKTAHVLPKGLEDDRRWMLIDDQSIGLTQRDYPKMATFRLSMENNGFSIHSDDEKILLDRSASGNQMRAKIWDDDVEVVEVSAEYSSWFSQRLGGSVRLVCFPETNARLVDPRYQIDHDHVSLADAYPLLIIGQRSLDDLNARLKIPIPMNRFRPNIVFDGGDPFDEDTWRNFNIGVNRFVAVKPCARCVVTTVDQSTGEKGYEPLATLSTYRKKENKVLFGQNLIAIDNERISVGDAISVETFNHEPLTMSQK